MMNGLSLSTSCQLFVYFVPSTEYGLLLAMLFSGENGLGKHDG
jgi:hypothetical protein